jgi:TPP-dependent pyruvate/acetoin dehydrogenase alpha subunit
MAERVEPGVRARVEQEVEVEIAEAFAFAESSPFPSAAELMTDIFQEN